MKSLDLNIVEIQGNEISKLMDYVKSVNFDYEKIIPVPQFVECKEDKLSEAAFFYRHLIKKEKDEEDDESFINIILKEAGYENITSHRNAIKHSLKNYRKTGFTSEYVFKCTQWSTMQKAKDLKFEKTQFEFYSEYPPYGIIEFLSKKFDVEILHYIADGYESVYHIKNGKSKRIHYVNEWQC